MENSLIERMKLFNRKCDTFLLGRGKRNAIQYSRIWIDDKFRSCGNVEIMTFIIHRNACKVIEVLENSDKRGT